MSLNGWVKIHRKVLDHWVAQEPELLALWIRLLIEANHADKKRMFNGALVDINRGQTIFGLEAFEAKSGISRKKLRRYLDMLELEGMIGRQKTNKYSLISILNYEDYQSEGSQEAGKGQAKGTQRAGKGQHRKNDKNVKNDNNTGASRFTPPSMDEVRQYCIERRNRVDPQRFIDFYESKGWMVGKNKMKDWKAAVRNWEKPEGKADKSGFVC